MGLDKIDGWSPTHWVMGFAVAYYLLSRDIDLIFVIPILLLWEAFEYTIVGPVCEKLNIKGTHRFPAGRDNGINIVSDMIFGLVGVVFAYFVFVG